ncbi:MAG: hypothetical protein IPH20_11810 [Bacteroidales bacterium]|nr:hypothetical protein [Bacteroidales bacterium]
MSTDILGFSQDDWDIFLKNLQDGKDGINDLIMGVKALGKYGRLHYDFVSAKKRPSSISLKTE